MDQKVIADLQRAATRIRQHIIEMLVEAGSGHSGGALGMADIFATLYFHVLRHRPYQPNWVDRDRLVLSNGHICPVLYATLAEAGYFNPSELKTLRKIESQLQGHPHRGSLPGLETTSGPLGQGLSQAVGMALAAQMDGRSTQVYCVTSDGEHNEGQTWEAVLCAAKYKLHNLAVIIDRNNIQIDGYTETVMPLHSLRAKYESFNWHVIEIDGHNFEQIIQACEESLAVFQKPVAIIAHTIPGKGVDFMQFKPEWHGKPPKAAEAKLALEQLKQGSASPTMKGGTNA